MGEITELRPGLVRASEVLPIGDVLADAAQARLVRLVVVGIDAAGEVKAFGSHGNDASLALLFRAATTIRCEGESE